MPNIRRFKLINSTEFQDLKQESRNLATLDLILKSGTTFEKLIWVAVAIFGTFWGFYFMFVQLQGCRGVSFVHVFGVFKPSIIFHGRTYWFHSFIRIYLT